MDEAAFRELVSGERRGALAGLLRGGLTAASVPYRLAVTLRNLGYDAHLLRTHRGPVPVISVGNLTAGGTGKTPLVAWLAHWLTERRIPLALLSRGYRSLDDQTNDERLVLDQLCPGVPHLQHPDRVGSATRACRDHGVQALVLDDGFQHRRLGRDLDIVLVDALNPWGYGHLLPRGLLREPRSSLHRADFVIITRCDASTESQRNALRAEIARHCPAPVAEVAFRPTGLIDAAGATAPLDVLAGRTITAFCGVGNPAAFERTLHALNLDVADFIPFPDHHHYTPAELRQLSETGRGELLLTTQKDIVKLHNGDPGGKPLWAVQIAAHFHSGAPELERRLTELFKHLPAPQGNAS